MNTKAIAGLVAVLVAGIVIGRMSVSKGEEWRYFNVGYIPYRTNLHTSVVERMNGSDWINTKVFLEQQRVEHEKALAAYKVEEDKGAAGVNVPITPLPPLSH